MNDLSSSLEASTKQKAVKLQLIQTVALILSLLLFANIVFNAPRRLRTADAEIVKAQRETTEILATVKEGFFAKPKLSHHQPALRIAHMHFATRPNCRYAIFTFITKHGFA